MYKFLEQSKIYRLGIGNTDENIYDIFGRVSKAIGSIESKFTSKVGGNRFEEQSFNLLKQRKFIPNTTILMNAGRFNSRPLSACTVPFINLDSDKLKIKEHIDRCHIDGMGTGFSFDDLEDPISMIYFLNRLGIEGQNNTKQLRPVGNMGTINITNSKIREFINLKQNKKLDKWVFNFSINISDNFLRRIRNNEDIILEDKSKIQSDNFLKMIARAIYFTGEPGLVFIDRHHEDNQVPNLGEYKSLAPCGEVGLTDGETCQFVYINLGEFVKNRKIKYEELEDVIYFVIRFLDDIVEHNILVDFDDTSTHILKGKRKIGLGVCGFADLLKELGQNYVDSESLKTAENIFSFINFISKKASILLAKERGSFLEFFNSKYMTDNNIIRKYAGRPTETVSKEKWVDLEKEIKINGIRNCSTIALPPTGRSSYLIKASQSIEPYFDEILEVSPYQQLKMISVIQKFVDESISKTINLSESITIEEIKHIILDSLDLPLKGITFYRDMSRNGQPVTLN